MDLFDQVSFEWPLVFKDVVEWVQHPEKTGVFFHEENICKIQGELKPSAQHWLSTTLRYYAVPI